MSGLVGHYWEGHGKLSDWPGWGLLPLGTVLACILVQRKDFIKV